MTHPPQYTPLENLLIVAAALCIIFAVFGAMAKFADWLEKKDREAQEAYEERFTKEDKHQ